jgi:hypothetical protein
MFGFSDGVIIYGFEIAQIGIKTLVRRKYLDPPELQWVTNKSSKN